MHLPRPLLLALLLSVLASPALAQDKKGNNEQVRRLQSKLQALQREQASLSEGKAEADKQLKETGDKLSAARASADAAQRQRRALEQELAAAHEESSAQAAKLAELEQALAQAQAQAQSTRLVLGASEDMRRQLEGKLATREQELATCGAKNDSLHRLGVAAFKLYEEKSCGLLQQADVLTRLKQVGAENMVDEYREKLDADLVKPQLDRQQARRAAELAARAQEEEAARDKAEQERQKQARIKLAKTKEQSDLDKLTRRVKRLFENIEW